MPIIFMLLGLIFLCVSFEFRFKALDHERHIWDKAFIGGSIVAAFFQGVVLGAYLNGIPVVDRAYAGGAMDWLTPFSIFTGVGVILAYTLLGSTWLIMKTEGKLQKRMMTDQPAGLDWLGIMSRSYLDALEHAEIARRWFTTRISCSGPWPVTILVGLFSVCY